MFSRSGASAHGVSSRRASLAALLLLFAIGSMAARAQEPAPAAAPSPAPLPPAHVKSIDVQGVHRLTADQVIKLSGLQIGQLIDRSTLEAAASRIVATGLFSGARFHEDRQGDNAFITFVVGEIAWTMPVEFDNFVWFSDAEIRDAVAEALPTFDGTTVPDSDNALTTVGLALTRLLAAAHIDGHVIHDADVDAAGHRRRELYRVAGVPLPVCSIQFTNAAGVPDADLVRSLKFLVGSEYSRIVVERAMIQEVAPLYRQRGFLRAVLHAPAAHLIAPGQCAPGIVQVTVSVDEGAAYAWDHAEWSGERAFSAGQLDAALGMRAGAIADGTKIDQGLDAVKAMYNRAGYAEISLSGAPVFDDARHTVTYRLVVSEGPVYHMGALAVTGASEQAVARLMRLWPLAPGTVFDTTRIAEFMKKAMAAQVLPVGKLLTVDPKPNRANGTVDVTLVVK